MDRSWWRVLTKYGPLEKGMANHFSILALSTPWTVWKGKKKKKKKNWTLKDDLPRSEAAQYATGDQWRNNSRKNETMEPKQKPHPAVDVTGDGSKVLCYKGQYCIGTWNVRSMNKANWKWSNRRWQEWTLTFRNQWTKILEWVNLTEVTIISTTVGKNPLEEME